MKKNIYQLASEFEIKLKKYAQSNYPSASTVFPVIENVVKSVKSQNPQLLGGVKFVEPNIRVEASMDNTVFVYFQLVVKANQYEQLISEPDKTQISNLLKPVAERQLSQSFESFNFNVKVGIVPE